MARQHKFNFFTLAVPKKVLDGRRSRDPARDGPNYHGAFFKHGLKVLTIGDARFLSLRKSYVSHSIRRKLPSSTAVNGGWHCNWCFKSARTMASKAQAWLEGQALRDPRRVRGQDSPAQWCRWKGDLESVHLFGLVPMDPAVRWDVPSFAFEDMARWMHLFSARLDDCAETKHAVHNMTAYFASGGARAAAAKERARRRSPLLQLSKQRGAEGRGRWFERAREMHGIDGRSHRVGTHELHPRPQVGAGAVWWDDYR